MTDLLSALAPPPADDARPRGLIEGPPGWHEGLCAGLRCWCGPVVGWRDLGELVGGPDCERVVVHQHGRLMVIWWEPHLDGGRWQSAADVPIRPTHWMPLPEAPR